MAEDNGVDVLGLHQQTGNLWEGLGAAGWGALNSALFDIPEYLAKKVAPSETYKKLLELEQRNQGAYTAGQLAGLFVPTGGLVAKGAKVSLGAAKAGLEAAKAGKLAKAAEQGLSVAQAAKAAEQAAKLGVKAERYGRLAEKAGTAEDIIRGTQKASGFKRGVYTAAEQALPRTIMNVAEGEDLGTAAEQAGVATLLGGVGGAALSKLGGAKRVLRKYAPELAETGAAARAAQTGAETSVLMRAVKGARSTEGLGDKLLAAGPARDAYANTMKAFKIRDPIDLKNVFGGAEITQQAVADAVQRSNPGVDRTIADKVADAIRVTIGRAEADISGAGKAALDVVPKGVEGLGKYALAGAGLGATGGGLASLGEEGADKSKVTRGAITGALLGAGGKLGVSALGKLAARGVPAALEATSKLGTKLAGALPEKFGEGAAKAAPLVSKAAGAMLIKPTKAEAKAVEADAAATPSQKYAAKTEMSEKYATVIEQKLQDGWISQFAPLGLSYEDFKEEVRNLTDDFDPIKSAAVLFPDPKEREKFLKDYDIALRIQSVNLTEAYKGGAPQNIIESIFNPNNGAEQRKAYSDLIDIASSVLAREGGIPTNTERKKVESDIKLIVDLPVSDEEKKQMLLSKLADYGLSLNSLQDLGLM